jgi:ADP-ribosylglycohydrolase
MISCDSISASIYAAIVGDALGVPVESSTRQQLALSSVKNMLGYGRYDQPEGTWSDDSSMMLCTMESLSEGYDINKLAAAFCKWLFESYWTPGGYVFDVGLTTFLALESIRNGEKNAGESGCTGEDENGNGSLMRILPAALYFAQLPVNAFLERIHEISAVTHAHPRSKIGCGIYALLVRALLGTADKNQAYKTAVTDALKFYETHNEFRDQLKYFMRVLSYEIPTLSAGDIHSSGYVVHTLEAAMWSFLKNTDTKSCLLEAVNLGLDTDTTGTVAGGLAGLVYGTKSIPAEWMSALARKDDIDILLEHFCASVLAQHSRGHSS